MRRNEVIDKVQAAIDSLIDSQIKSYDWTSDALNHEDSMFICSGSFRASYGSYEAEEGSFFSMEDIDLDLVVSYTDEETNRTQEFEINDADLIF